MEAILDAAARVFGRDGYAGATTNRIADVAGVSIGSVYQYFPNKDALVVALHARHSRRMQAVMTAVLDGTNEASLRDNIAGL
ncbi:MAG TPA: helix-turn-helix domain-containing protein, partial [Casimicrobiaceae bacterium]